MAHSCPECDMVCHCGGDIDDMVLDGTEEQDKCIHYKDCMHDDDDQDENYVDDNEDFKYGDWED